MQNDKKNDISFVFNDAVLFDMLVLLFFLLITFVAFNYNPRARSIPLGLGILGSIMTCLQLLSDALPRLRSVLRFVSQSGILGEAMGSPIGARKTNAAAAAAAPAQTVSPEKEEKQSVLQEWWQVFRLFLWLSGFIALLSFSNYLIAVGLFIILLARFEARESWKSSILLSVCVTTSFFILFDIILTVQL